MDQSKSRNRFADITRFSMAERVVIFRAGMTCGGCANACSRILNKIPGVTNVACDVEGQRITVQCTPDADCNSMLQALQKWGSASGKVVELIG